MIYQEVIVHIHISGTLATGDSKFKWVAPYAGCLKSVKGFIETLGSDAGTSTDYQIRNYTDSNRDMLSTVGAFEVNSATNLLEGQAINTVYDSFTKAAVIHIDCDAVSTGPANAHLYLTVGLFLDDV